MTEEEAGGDEAGWELPHVTEGASRRLSAKLASKAAPPLSAVGASGNRPDAVKRWGEAARSGDADENALLEKVSRQRRERELEGVVKHGRWAEVAGGRVG